MVLPTFALRDARVLEKVVRHAGLGEEPVDYAAFLDGTYERNKRTDVHNISVESQSVFMEGTVRELERFFRPFDEALWELLGVGERKWW